MDEVKRLDTELFQWNLLSEEQKEAVLKAFQNIVDIVINIAEKIIKAIIDAFVPAIEAALKTIRHYLDEAFRNYPNRRVVHLARYHRSERVRKKNRKRILKWIERGCKV